MLSSHLKGVLCIKLKTNDKNTLRIKVKIYCGESILLILPIYISF